MLNTATVRALHTNIKFTILSRIMGITERVLTQRLNLICYLVIPNEINCRIYVTTTLPSSHPIRLYGKHLSLACRGDYFQKTRRRCRARR